MNDPKKTTPPPPRPGPLPASSTPPKERPFGVIVAPGKTINLGEGKVLRPKTVVRAGLHGITDENIDTWLRDGTLVEVNTGEEINEAEIRTRRRSPAVPSGEVDERGNLIAPPEPRTGAAHGRPEGKWSYDPKTLKGKRLDQLNALVAGIDSRIPAFETEEEAIAQLSQDWRKSHPDEPRARVS